MCRIRSTAAQQGEGPIRRLLSQSRFITVMLPDADSSGGWSLPIGLGAKNLVTPIESVRARGNRAILHQVSRVFGTSSSSLLLTSLELSDTNVYEP